MTIETTPGNFSVLLKNINKMELDEKIMKKLTTSKIGYLVSKDYLMTRQENLPRAIKELKGWQLI